MDLGKGVKKDHKKLQKKINKWGTLKTSWRASQTEQSVQY